VKYNGSGEFVEIYNSGSLNAGGKPSITIEKKLSEYTDITTASEFLVTVEAYNRDGGYHKFSKSSKYGDTTPPVCGEITGQAGENQWYTAPRTSTISVKCSDEKNGSGCVKNEYKKSWNTEIEDDVITISDNAGNTTDCKVRVHHDWTKPTLTVVAYKRNSDGSKGEQVGSITANHSSATKTLNDYTGNVNGWLNKTNYPYGILYEIITSDNVLLNQGKWSENENGFYSGSSINNLTLKNTKELTKTDNKEIFSLVEEGMRRAKYVLTDQAGQTVTVSIEANIDRTNPTCSTSKSNQGSESGVNVRISCNDSGSECSSSNRLSYNGVKSSSTYTVSDTAGNTNTCSVSVSHYDCNPFRYECGRYVCGSYKCGEKTYNLNTFGQAYRFPIYCKKYCTKYCTGYKRCYK
jgi:hypothetical protein